jgi:integrase
MIRVLVRRKGRKFLTLYYVDPQSGRTIYRSAKTDDPKQAERAAADWERELLDSRGVDGCSWQWFRSRFESEHLADKPRKSRNSYLAALDHFERVIKLGTVADVTSDHVSTFRGKLLDEDRPVATVANILTHLRASFKWAERIGMLRRCPHFSMPRVVRKKLMRGRAIDDAEFDKMIKHCHTPYGKARADEWKRLLTLIRKSGLRLEEALQVRWDAPPIQAMPDAKPHPCLVFFGEAQKSGEDEIAPCTPDFTAWLRVTPPSQRHGLIAPVHGLRGQVLTHDKVSRAISDIGRAAKVFVAADGKPASAHDLRRAFAREWAAKVKPLVLQRLMRHSSITTTMRYYAHLDSEDIGAALWQVGYQVGGKGGSHSGRKSGKAAQKGRSQTERKP